MTRHRERHAYQQHNRHFKEQRERANQPGKANRIVRAVMAKGFKHLDGYLIDRAGFMQNLAKHRPQRDHNRQEAQRAAHPFFHGRGDFIKRHP